MTEHRWPTAAEIAKLAIDCPDNTELGDGMSLAEYVTGKPEVARSWRSG